MKNFNFLATPWVIFATLCFFVFGCSSKVTKPVVEKEKTKLDYEPYTKEELIDLYKKKAPLDWKKEKDAKLIYSVAYYAGNVISVGYSLANVKDLSRIIHKIDVNAPEWKAAKEKVMQVILEGEGRTKEEVIYHEFDKIPSFGVKNISISTIAKLMEMEEVRYVEPMGTPSIFYGVVPDIYNQELAGYEIGNSLYAIKDNKVYYRRKEIKNCNAATFRKISEFHWSDGKSIYWAGLALPEVDVETFDASKGFVADKNHVYARNKIVVGFSPSEFEAMMDEKGKLKESYVFLRDSEFIYKHRIKIPEADIKTFELIAYKEDSERRRNCWARDKNHVYLYDRIVEGADPKTIMVLNNGQAKDKDEDYFILGREKVKIDPASFINFPNRMIKSNLGVYTANGKRLNNVDAETFEVIYKDGKEYGKDKNGIFEFGKRQ